MIVPSGVACICCGQARGYIYTGPVYAVEDLDDQLCPWCIADGSAAERFKASFTGGTLADDVLPEVFSAVGTRTPGFTAWQEPHWLFHCGDGAAFIGLAGSGELTAYPDALEMLRQEATSRGWPPEEVNQYLSSLDKDDQPTAYLFRCRVCEKYLAYSDFT